MYGADYATETLHRRVKGAETTAAYTLAYVRALVL